FISSATAVYSQDNWLFDLWLFHTNSRCYWQLLCPGYGNVYGVECTEGNFADNLPTLQEEVKFLCR
ncbi:hypothetical protein Tsp_08790, partial [Trichinella spiralis]|uniref:hypothetical protein n=1 Tax=Trichinella spiralis TaxID=6334 RepID=UPI0001EFE4D6